MATFVCRASLWPHLGYCKICKSYNSKNHIQWLITFIIISSQLLMCFCCTNLAQEVTFSGRSSILGVNVAGQTSMRHRPRSRHGTKKQQEDHQTPGGKLEVAIPGGCQWRILCSKLFDEILMFDIFWYSLTPKLILRYDIVASEKGSSSAWNRSEHR